jgi:hypothetical protein
MLAEGKVGAPGATISDQTVANLRFSKLQALVNTDAHGRFYEAAIRGKLFYAQTAVTGVAPGTAIGTTAAFAFFMPKGAGVNAVIYQASMAYVSGTLGAGLISWCVNSNLSEAVPTGTAITAKNCFIGGVAPTGTALTTATLATAPSPVRNFCSLGASLATTAVQPWQIYDNVDGALVVPAGGSISLQGTAAGGSSPLVVFSLLWEEVPI